jgi:hypothetical protein
MKKLLGLFFLLLPLLSHSSSNLGYVAFGPMLHWNSRNSEVEFSYGFEVSYWNIHKGVSDEVFFYDNTPDFQKVGYGVDIGMEFSKIGRRIYCEPQLQWKMVGLSLGPVYEKRYQSGADYLGLQGSLWTLIFPVDLRFRSVNDEFYFSPGLFIKLPVLISN